MKKLFLIFTVMFSMLLASCETSAQVVYTDDYDYYEYYDSYYNTPIVYINTIPYYRYWIDGRWRFYLVPDARLPFIRRFDHPIMQPREFRHDGMGHVGREFRPMVNNGRGGNRFGNMNRGTIQPNNRQGNVGTIQNRGTVQNRGTINRGTMQNGNGMRSSTRPSFNSGSMNRGGSMPQMRGGISMGRGGRR